MPDETHNIKVELTAEEDVTRALDSVSGGINKVVKDAEEAQKEVISLADAIRLATQALRELAGAGVNVDAIKKLGEQYGQNLASSITSGVMSATRKGFEVDAEGAVQARLEQVRERMDQRAEVAMARSEQALTSTVERGAQARIASVQREIEQEMSQRERAITREINSLLAHNERIGAAIRQTRATVGAEMGLSPSATRRVMTTGIQEAYNELSQNRGRIVELEKQLGTERYNIMRQNAARIEQVNAEHQAKLRKSAEETFFLVQDLNKKSGELEQARLSQERKSAEDTFFLVQEIRQKGIQAELKAEQEKTRIDQAAMRDRLRIAETEHEQRQAILRGVGIQAAAGLGINIPAIFSGPGGVAGAVAGAATGGIASLVGGAANLVGNVLGTAAHVGYEALMLIPRAFVSIASSALDAASAVGNFVSQGLALVGVYEILTNLEGMFRKARDSVLDYQVGLATIMSLTTHVGQNIEQINDDVLRISMETGRPARELADAFFLIESHGYNAAESANILDRAARLAASGFGTTTDAVRLGTGALTAYGYAADRATEVFDVLARTEQVASVPVGELVGQYQRLIPLTAALHIPLDQVGAAIATLTQTGLPASRVITDLIATFQALVHITPVGMQQLHDMGLTVDQLTQAFQGDKGVLNGLMLIWEKSGHDITKLNNIFGDGTRALIGVLTLLEKNGQRFDENLEKMRKSAGAVDDIFRIAMATVSRQLERFEAIITAVYITLTSKFLPGIGDWMKSINDAFAEGDITTGMERLLTGIQQGAASILKTMGDLATQMFGAGVNLVSELAKGMFEAGDRILTLAANYLADIVAGFLLGASPPKQGPLHYIQQGTQQWMQAYAQAMTANADIMTGAAGNVATAVNEQLATIGQVKAGGAGTVAGLRQQIEAIDQQLLPWKLATDEIKANYDAMLSPIEMQIRAIERIKDLEYDRKQLQFEQRNMELDMLKLRAEGDPARRAQLAGQMERQRLISEQHSIDREIASLQRRQRELGRQRMTPQERALAQQEIRDQLNTLNIRKQQAALVNPQLMAEYATKKATLEYDKDAAKLQHDSFVLQQKMTLQPLIEQRDKIKVQLETELDYINKQTIGLETQRKILEAQRQLLGADKAAGAGAGGGTRGGIPQIGGDPSAQAARVQAAVDSYVKTFSSKLELGFANFFRSDLFKRIGEGVTGALLGYMVGGIPGAVAGAKFWPTLMDELRKRGVTEASFAEGAQYWWTEFKAALEKARVPLAAGDIFGSWESFRQSVADWFKQGEAGVFGEFYTKYQRIAETGGEGNPAAQAGAYVRVAQGTPGASRYTGIGRTIMEALFGDEARAKELNYQTAYEMIDTRIVQPIMKALNDSWNKFTRPTIDPQEPGKKMPSPAETMVRQIIQSITGALRAVVDVVDPDMEAALMDFGRKLGGYIAQGIGEAIWSALSPGMPSPEERARQDAIKRARLQAIAASLPAASALPPAPGVPPVAPGATGAPYQGTATGNRSILNLPADIINFGGTIAAAVQSWMTGKEGKDETGKVGQSFTEGVATGMTNDVAMGYVDKSSLNLVNGLVDNVKKYGKISSPAEVMVPLGEAFVDGLNKGIQDHAEETGPIVRMWLRSYVIAPAMSILTTGEQSGKRGGLPGVAQDAIDAMSGVFAQGVPSAMQTNLELFGGSMASYIMIGFTDPKSGLAAQMRRYYNTLPPPPPGGTPPASADQGSGGPGAQPHYARGGEFMVGGNRPGDSQYVSFWATPGEHVAITSAGQHGGGDININAPLIQADRIDNDTDLDQMLDRVRDFLVNDIRVARGQGVSRPGGITPRGAR